LRLHSQGIKYVADAANLVTGKQDLDGIAASSKRNLPTKQRVSFWKDVIEHSEKIVS
jgi:hypothetical protein